MEKAQSTPKSSDRGPHRPSERDTQARERDNHDPNGTLIFAHWQIADSLLADLIGAGLIETETDPSRS
jgi:hypothetical protein